MCDCPGTISSLEAGGGGTKEKGGGKIGIDQSVSLALVRIDCKVSQPLSDPVSSIQFTRVVFVRTPEAPARTRISLKFGNLHQVCINKREHVGETLRNPL